MKKKKAYKMKVERQIFGSLRKIKRTGRKIRVNDEYKDEVVYYVRYVTHNHRTSVAKIHGTFYTITKRCPTHFWIEPRIIWETIGDRYETVLWLAGFGDYYI